MIDTTNFSTHRTFRQIAGLEVSGEHVHLIERLAPIDDGNTIRYDVTVEDPTTWTRPWTAAVTWRKGVGLYEYACHEGNYATKHSLSGARAKEKAEEAGKN